MSEARAQAPRCLLGSIHACSPDDDAPNAARHAPLHAAHKHTRVLQSLVATLAEVGRDGAGGVPCQRHDAPHPVRHGGPVIDTHLCRGST